MSITILAVLCVLLFVVAGVIHLVNKAIPSALVDFGLAILAWILLL